MPSDVHVVVFSDVDSVLRNPPAAAMHHAASTLQRLPAGAAVVLCSSRTRAELELVQQWLQLRAPFVVEDGAALFVPANYFGRPLRRARDIAGYEAIEIGCSHRLVRATLQRVAGELKIRITGFSDMSIEEVARECGITLLQARLAKLREYVEPCIARDDRVPRDIFVRVLQSTGLKSVRRGAHEYIGGVGESPDAVQRLLHLYRRAFGAVASIGVISASASSADDRLLDRVDRKVIVHDDERAVGAVDIACWAETILDLVEEARSRASARAS